VITLLRAVRYIVRNRVPGDFVECEVWRGGSMMAIALALQEAGETDRNLLLYDTFTGMSAPTSSDKRYDGVTASSMMASGDMNARVFSYASMDDVKANMTSTRYPPGRIH
jgi:hypothetical protein